MTDTPATKKTAPRKRAAAAKAAAAPKVPAPKPVAAVTAPADAEASLPAGKVRGATLKMKDLVAQVSDAAGGRKKGVKEIVEATLTALGAALGKGDAINLPGFGRAKVAHPEDKGTGKPMTIKLRSQPAAAARKAGKEGLAEAAE
ncbi:MAG: HU family DNA-binding protein [Rhodobacteraceae bacterium]|jgi:nucleoid DNA-binding protein|nr:HU family DNA-binding protein [Paracoccaceae bacterium]